MDQSKYYSNPYFDDFDESKNFHQIMFNPEYAIQSRELTQLQTILQSQIERFGNHIFKHGSVVIPGNAIYESGLSVVTYTHPPIPITVSVGDTLVQSFSADVDDNVTGVVRYVSVATGITTVFMTVNKGSREYSDFQDISSSNSLHLKTGASTVAVGTITAAKRGSLAHVENGVYYVNGYFVSCGALASDGSIGGQTVEVSRDVVLFPDHEIVFEIVEDIVTYHDDTTLLDPANNSNNYAAPGADRRRIRLVLQAKPSGFVADKDYVSLLSVKEDKVVRSNKFAKYNEIEKTIARRTYDESGDYVVMGFKPTIVEYLKREQTPGYSSATPSASLNATMQALATKAKFVASQELPATPALYRDFLALTVNPGKGYIKGFESELESQTVIAVPKALATKSITEHKSHAKFGQYLYVGALDLVGPLPEKGQVLTLKSSTGSVVGTGKYYAFNSLSTAIIRLFLFDLDLTGSIDTVSKYEYVVGSSTYSGSVLSRAVIISQEGASIGNTASTLVPLDHEVYHDSSSTKKTDLYEVDGNVFYFRGRVDSQAGYSVTVGANTTRFAVKSSKSYGRYGDDVLILPLPKYSVKSTKSHHYVVQAKDERSLSGAFAITLPDCISTSEADVFVTLRTSTSTSNSIIPISALVGYSYDPLSRVVSGTAAAGTIATFIYKKLVVEDSDGRIRNASGTISVSVPSGATKVKLPNVYSVGGLISVFDGSTDVSGTWELVDENDMDNAFYLARSGPAPSATTLTVSLVNYYEKPSASTNKILGPGAFGQEVVNGSVENTGVAPVVYESQAGKKYDMRRHIDFRGVDGALWPGELVQFDFDYFLAREDLVVLNRDGMVQLVIGDPADTTSPPLTPENTLKLYGLMHQGMSDIGTIAIKKPNNRRKTMEDINRLESRVKNLEEFSVLSALESDALAVEVKDAETGLNRFKSGYLVEDFRRALLTADVNNSDVRCTISNGLLPGHTIRRIDAEYNQSGSGTVQWADGSITLPYTEEVLTSQTKFSKSTNLNPFGVFGWDGSMALHPPYTSFVEVVNMPLIVEVVKERIETVREVSYYPAAPTIPAAPIAVDVPVVTNGWETSGQSSYEWNGGYEQLSGGDAAFSSPSSDAYGGYTTGSSAYGGDSSFSGGYSGSDDSSGDGSGGE